MEDTLGRGLCSQQGDQRVGRGEEKAVCPVPRVVGGHGCTKGQSSEGPQTLEEEAAASRPLAVFSPWSWEKGS